jgi:alkylation response protein AidB-like acyl-CoA dehydrogenase
MFTGFELTEEQRLLQDAVRGFAKKEFTPERSREYEEKGEFPWELYRKMCQQGYLSVQIPEEYGGQGLGLIEELIVIYESVKVEPVLAYTVWCGIFGVDYLINFGTHEQKAKWLPKIAKGEIVSTAMFTEPAGGSDLTRVLDTRAVKVGDKVWKINGTKTFITNGTIFDVACVLTQTDPNAKPPYRGQTVFVVERKPGIDATLIKGKMGWHCSPTAEVSFSDVEVTDDDILGGPANLNRGFYQAISFLDESRVKVACAAVATAEAALEKAIQYAKERKAFGRIIAGFQGLAYQIVDVATKVELAKSMIFRTAKVVERARHDKAMMDEAVKLASMLKWYGAKLAVEACDLAVEVLGGYGYIAEYDVERWFRFAKVLEIVEGTREIQKNAIARYVLGREAAQYF